MLAKMSNTVRFCVLSKQEWTHLAVFGAILGSSPVLLHLDELHILYTDFKHPDSPTIGHVLRDVRGE